jgi:hypothetical protein
VTRDSATPMARKVSAHGRADGGRETKKTAGNHLITVAAAQSAAATLGPANHSAQSPSVRKSATLAESSTMPIGMLRTRNAIAAGRGRRS